MTFNSQDPGYTPIDVVIIMRQPASRINSLVERAKLVLQVDKAWEVIYTALNRKAHDSVTKQFFDEFSQANTVEQQVQITDRWMARL